MFLPSQIIGGLALAALALSGVTAHAATDLIVNGGFEAGASNVQSPDPITGWASAERGILGGVMVLSGNESLVSGGATVGAASGKNYALLDTAGNADLALLQRFTVAQALQSATLSFDWFANYGGTQAGPVGQAFGLDHTTGGSYDANVHIRVDILKDGASDFSTAATDLIWSGAADTLSKGPNNYTQAQISLDSSLFEAGKNYTLRFAAVSNDGSLIAGLDNVALNVEVSPVPEPQSWALMAAGLGLLMASRRSSAKRR